MQTGNKKYNTYYAMALLLMGLTITPVSLKACGFSPNFSAGVDAWRQIASVFGDSHQPATSAELWALNDRNPAPPDDAQPESQVEPPLYAEARPMETAIASANTAAIVAPQVQQANVARRPCSVAANRQAPAMNVVAEVTIEKQVSDALALRVKDIEAADLAKQTALIDQERSRKLDKQIAQCRIELNEVLKVLPVQDVKTLMRFKQVAVPFGRADFEYDFHVPIPEVKRRQGAGHAPAIVQTSFIPENAEL